MINSSKCSGAIYMLYPLFSDVKNNICAFSLVCKWLEEPFGIITSLKQRNWDCALHRTALSWFILSFCRFFSYSVVFWVVIFNLISGADGRSML